MNQPILISIDLETRGQDPAACAIASIGMAASGWNSEGWLDTYYAEIAAASALQYGQEDADTMEWWAKQPQHTQAVLTRGRILIPDALAALAEKIAALNPKNEQGRYSSRVVIIARGPQFDLTILRRHFAAAGIPCPWAYWQERCHRSLEQAWRAVAKSRSGTPWPKYTDYSPAAHNAEVDAKQQATYLIKLAAQVRSQQP